MNGERALDALREAFGSRAVLEDPAGLSPYAGAEFPAPEGEPVCAVKPGGAGDVVELVRLARREGMNLVPVSSSPPHRKGGSRPRGRGVMVDLTAMRGIVRMDRRNRVALVEPGVTFPQLREAASRQGLRVLAPLAPRPGKSALAACLEREPFLIPKYHWDTTDPLLCMEVVFGTADVFRTGSAAGPGGLEDQWECSNFQKNPMGPASSDLGKLVQGSQGTLGLVTWGSIKLELEPALRRCYLAEAGEPGPLLELARGACRRRLGDEMLLLDRLALACLLEREPRERQGEAGGEGRPAYALIYILSGIEGYLPGKRVALQERAMAELAREAGLSRPRLLEGGEEKRLLGELEGGEGTWWKHRLRGGCQELFFLTTMDRAPRLISMLREAAGRRGFAAGEPAVYLQPLLQGRACHLELLYFHDPSDGEERKRAREAAREAAGLAAGQGAFLSRPHPPWEDTAYSRCPDSVSALRRLKRVFDPDGVLNRGRLCFADNGGGA